MQSVRAKGSALSLPVIRTVNEWIVLLFLEDIQCKQLIAQLFQVNIVGLTEFLSIDMYFISEVYVEMPELLLGGRASGGGRRTQALPEGPDYRPRARAAMVRWMSDVPE